MTDPDVKALARKIHLLEKKIAALSRSRQLTSSSIPVTVDGEDGPEVIDVPLTAGVSQGILAWDQSEYAVELAEQLEGELGPLPGQIQAALGEAAAALEESGLARSEAATAVADASAAVADATQAIEDAGLAQAAADGAATAAVAAQGAAAAAQGDADQAIADALAAADLAAAKGRVWAQDVAPPAGRTFEWLGPVNSSPSVEKLDGVEIRRNLVRNPRPKSNWAVNGSTAHVKGYTPEGWVIVGEEGPSIDSFADLGSVANNTSLLPLTTYTLSARIRVYPGSTGAGTQTNSIWVYVAGTLLGYAQPPGVNVPGEYDLSVTFTTPAILTGLTSVRLYSGRVGPADWTNVQLEINTIASPYFDGSTPSDRTYDLWINTTDGKNTPNRWVNGAWQVVTDKAATDAAAAAAAAQTKADQAFADAAAAATAAGNAQTSANGKNRVWYQGTAPAGTGHKTGDTWFDTSNGNRVTQWDGDSWEATQFGTGAIATAAITNALIADATIQSAKIANLDAAKITTGTLNAARIAALSITTGHLAANAVTAAKIAALTITAAEIASNAVTAVKVAANAVTAEKINAGAVTTVKLDALAVTAEKIAAGAIIADKIAANAITAGKIAAEAIDGMTITGAKIRTSPTGQRLELDVNGLVGYDASGSRTVALEATGTGMQMTDSLDNSISFSPWTGIRFNSTRPNSTGNIILTPRSFNMYKEAAGYPSAQPVFQVNHSNPIDPDKITVRALNAPLSILADGELLISDNGSDGGIKFSGNVFANTIRGAGTGQILTLSGNRITLDAPVVTFQGDTDWANVFVPGGTGDCQWRRAAGIIYFQFDITFTTAVAANGTKDPMTTLPFAARPVSNTPISMMGHGSYPATGYVQAGGGVVFRNTYTGGNTRFYGAGDWPAAN